MTIRRTLMLASVFAGPEGKALKSSKSLDKTQQKELLRTIQTLLEDAVPADFDAWLKSRP